MNDSRNAECIMPDSGLRAPARILVAVRAIVPVTLMPPNRAEAMLAMPCATSSMLERCLRPVMPSATFAESRLSTPPSSVKDSDAGRTCSSSAQENWGMCGTGRPRGISPNRLPMVSTGRCSSSAANDAITIAISIAGHAGRQARNAKITAAEPAPIASADQFRVGSAWPSAASFGTNGPGSAPASVSPPRSCN